MADRNGAGNPVEPSRPLTFSEAHGYSAVPRALNLEELPEPTRLVIWNVIYLYIMESVNQHWVIEPWWSILRTTHTSFFEKPIDEWSDRHDWNCRRVKFVVLDERNRFNRVFDLIQLMMRHPACPSGFVEDMRSVFQMQQVAYTIVEGDPITIMPAATPVERKALAQATGALHEAGLSGAEAHLKNSASALNAGNWADAVRESIHAVESVARLISPGSSSLKVALRSLPEHALHPALAGGFEKIYGYTSDEQGIRHALLERREANVGQDEAVFMLGACASFASFLWRKHQAGKPE